MVKQHSKMLIAEFRHTDDLLSTFFVYPENIRPKWGGEEETIIRLEDEQKNGNKAAC
jgi:hypothetical protein